DRRVVLRGVEVLLAHADPRVLLVEVDQGAREVARKLVVQAAAAFADREAEAPDRVLVDARHRRCGAGAVALDQRPEHIQLLLPLEHVRHGVASPGRSSSLATSVAGRRNRSALGPPGSGPAPLEAVSSL